MSHIVGFFVSLPFLIGIFLFLILYVIQTPILTFPIYFLMFYAGVIYGFWIGALINVSGMFLTTTIGYFVGNYGNTERLMKLKAMQKFQSWIEANGFRAIVFLRVLPVIPYNVTSLGSGLMKLDRSRYLTINSLAIIPFPVMWALIGDVFGAALVARLHFTIDYRVLAPTIIIVFIIGLLYFLLKTRLVDHEDISEELAI